MEDGRELTECILGIGDAAIVFAQREREKEVLLQNLTSCSLWRAISNVD